MDTDFAVPELKQPQIVLEFFFGSAATSPVRYCGRQMDCRFFHFWAFLLANTSPSNQFPVESVTCELPNLQVLCFYNHTTVPGCMGVSSGWKGKYYLKCVWNWHKRRSFCRSCFIVPIKAANSGKMPFARHPALFMRGFALGVR